jgi:hypothetical protein
MVWVWRTIKYAWLLFCLLFLIAGCIDFYSVLKNPDIYPFGAEGPYPYWYKTQRLYLWFDAIFIIWFAMGFLFCLLQNKFKNFKWGIIIHLIVTLLYVYAGNMGIL